jgi:Ca-activated chloride channel family protein
MNFKYPFILLLLLLVPLSIIFYIYTYKRYKSGISFPSIKIFKKIGTFRFSTLIIHLLYSIKLLALIVLIFAAARPQGERIRIEKEQKSIDIILALDISRSMNIIDINNDSRFNAARDVIKKFINKTKNNRLGLIAFAGESFTLVPLTGDIQIIPEFIDSLEIGDLEDGTAIGMAIANGCERLKKSKTENKVIILLTDGANTAGTISPRQGMELARSQEIRVYTIGFGTTGKVTLRETFTDTMGNKRTYERTVFSRLNTELLKEIAQTTNGKFYRVHTKNELIEVYDDINRLEKTKIKFKTEEGTVE